MAREETESRAPRVCVRGAGFPRGAGEAAQVTGEAAHHLARVLRVRAGEPLTLFDGAGLEVRVRVEAVASDKRGATVTVRAEVDPHEGVRGDALRVCWLQGFPKGDKLETVLREGTELGAHAFWPVYTERSVPRPRGGSGAVDARVERWKSVVENASAQCGRADVPEVRPACALDEALGAVPAWATLRIVAWEGGGEALSAVLERYAHEMRAKGAAQGTHEGGVEPHAQALGCAVLVGPEGGLDVGEVARARAHGFVSVTLGPRVLRTETVAPALLAALSYALGDLRGAANR